MQGSEFYSYLNEFPELKKHFRGVFSIGNKTIISLNLHKFNIKI
jgi:hypothetical protein